MEIAIDISNVKPRIVRNLMYADNFPFKIMMVLEDYLKVDLEGIIEDLGDEEAYGDMKHIIEKLKGVLFLNQSIGDYQQIQMKMRRGLIPLTMFFPSPHELRLRKYKDDVRWCLNCDDIKMNPDGHGFYRCPECGFLSNSYMYRIKGWKG